VLLVGGVIFVEVLSVDAPLFKSMKSTVIVQNNTREVCRCMMISIFVYERFFCYPKVINQMVVFSIYVSWLMTE
jgi:hypothetical protein